MTSSLKTEFAELRKRVASSQRPFAKSTKEERLARIKKASIDFEYFAKTYLPHHIGKPPSAMHSALYKCYSNLILESEKTGKGGRDATAAPRGNAKSTLTTLALPLWAIITERRKYIGILSDTTEQAQEFLEEIKAELEVNERLQEDYPKACGEGSRWKIGDIITKKSIKVKAWGKGKRIRGSKFGASRLDLVICDDLEDDEHIESPQQREKDRKWFFKAVMKAGAGNTVYIVVGTILHYDALLARLLNQPGWTSRKYQAVIKWSVSPLWEEWESRVVAKEEEEASRFFEKNKKEMLEGTQVLWPEVESYIYLMKMRLSDGPAYFDSEKQNEPIHPSERLFNDEWFNYLDEAEVRDRLRYNGYTQFLASVDPSLGKVSKSADPSAIVILGITLDGLMDVIEADIKKRSPDRIIEDLFDFHKIYRLDKVVVEEVQFQEFFKDTIIKESAKRSLYLPIEGTRPVSDKVLRITKLQPHIKNGFIRFRRAHNILLNQLKYFPKADHDDGPDALEMAFSLAEQGTGGPRIRRLTA